MAVGSARAVRCRIRPSRCTPPLPLSPTCHLYLSPVLPHRSSLSLELPPGRRHSIDPARCCAAGGRVSTWAVAPLLSRPCPTPYLPTPSATSASTDPHDVEPPPPLPPCWAQTYLIPHSGIWWPNTYLAKYPIYSSLFFFGYFVDTYPPRMRYVSIRDTYPQAERGIRAAQLVTINTR
jgi:hypothetical protein